MRTVARQATSIDVPGLRLDPEAVMDPARLPVLLAGRGRIEVEIGIGKGRFLLAAAEARPDVMHFGIEWAARYLRIAEMRAARQGLTNIRFARVDARELVEQGMPARSVSAYYIFYPDPWPKTRHRKRRLVTRTTADHIARTLVDAGLLHVATDHAQYWKSIRKVLDTHEAFECLPAFGGSEFPLPVDEPLTNFETKYSVEGRQRFRASWRLRSR
jgi:tRNA (guanine-N7-)-methyltransferase